MKIKRTLSVAALAAALCLGMSATPVAYGAELPVPPEPETLSVTEQIAAIPDAKLRGMVEARYAELVAQGADVAGVGYAPFELTAEAEAILAASPMVSPMSLPTGCTISVMAWYYGGAVYDEAITSCSSNFEKLVHDLRIVGVNPYNPYDNRILNQGSYTAGSGGTSYGTSTMSWGCNNTNSTNLHGFARGTIWMNGVKWAGAEVGDYLYSQPCGW